MPKPRKEILYPVWEALEKNISEELPLNELAFFSTYSPWHFHRLFRKFQKENVKDYIRRLRIEKAAYELRISQFPIFEIALEAGYTSREAFTKAFRKVLGTTPAEFRRKYSQPKLKIKTNALERFGIKINDLQIRKVSTFYLLYRRVIGPYQNFPGFPTDPDFFLPFLPWLNSKNLNIGNTKWIGVAKDDPEVTPADKIRFDFGTPVNSAFKAPPGLGVQCMKGGEALQIRVRLPYENLPDVYSMLLNEFFPTFHRRLANEPPFEVYVSDTELVTDIFFLLR